MVNLILRICILTALLANPALLAGPIPALAYGTRLITKAAVDRFYPSIKNRNILALNLLSSVEDIQRRFRLPPNSSKYSLMDALKLISIPKGDSEGLLKHGRALRFLEANDFVSTEGDISMIMNDLLFLAHRYGYSGADNNVLRAETPAQAMKSYGSNAPDDEEVSLGEFSSLLDRIKDTPLSKSIATFVPNDRYSLIMILSKDLEMLGFNRPHPINVSRQSLEELASWALTVRLSLGYFSQDAAARTMAPLASAIIDVVKSGKSHHFFGPSNDNALYRLVFDEWNGDFSSWTSFLQRAADYRREHQRASVMEALLETADGSEVGMRYFFLSPSTG